MADAGQGRDRGPDRAPGRGVVPLLVGAGLVALEGVVMVGLGGFEVLHASADRVTLAVTTTVFFVAFGVGLLACARGLALTRSWARGPVVATQLIGVLTATSFYGGETTWVALTLGAACLVALGCVLSPASTRALAADPH